MGASLSPHCLPASRLLPRVTSVHLPDYAHYHTIGPGMFPSSQIPSWKVCVSLHPPLAPSPPLHRLCAHPSSHPSPLPLFLSHSAFFPMTPPPAVSSHGGGGDPEASRQLRDSICSHTELRQEVAPFRKHQSTPVRPRCGIAGTLVPGCKAQFCPAGGFLRVSLFSGAGRDCPPRPRSPACSPESLIGPR